MREIRSLGSVRGVPGNWHSYRYINYCPVGVTGVCATREGAALALLCDIQNDLDILKNTSISQRRP